MTTIVLYQNQSIYSPATSSNLSTIHEAALSYNIIKSGFSNVVHYFVLTWPVIPLIPCMATLCARIADAKIISMLPYV